MNSNPHLLSERKINQLTRPLLRRLKKTSRQDRKKGDCSISLDELIKKQDRFEVLLEATAREVNRLGRCNATRLNLPNRTNP